MTAKNVDEYLANVPEEVRGTLERLRSQIKAAAPKAEEGISYQIPYYKHHGMLVAFAGFKNHCSLFAPGTAKETFKAELAPFKTHKATIQFSVEKPLPAGLVKKLVKARVAENEGRG